MTWTTRTAQVQAGEYVESTVNVTEHVSDDHRFTIKRCGFMGRRRSHGAHGDLHYRWMWTGYRLTDHSTELPKWVSSTKKFSTVRECKHEAERRSVR
jgi:hypothetical protein